MARQDPVHDEYSKPRFSWRIEHPLAAGFFLIILLGLLGYFQTVWDMQASAAAHTKLRRMSLPATRQNSRQDQAVVQAIIGMAHALGLEVIAEGVETVARRDRFRRLSCDYMQGFLHSPPVTPERLEAMLMPAHLQSRKTQLEVRETQAA